jgi:hypothetical protein
LNPDQAAGFKQLTHYPRTRTHLAASPLLAAITARDARKLSPNAADDVAAGDAYAADEKMTLEAAPEPDPNVP